MKISFINPTRLTFKVWIFEIFKIFEASRPQKQEFDSEFDNEVDGRLQIGEFRLYFESKNND